MKKGVRFFIGFVILITVGMSFFDNKNIVGDTIQVIRETKEVSLNDFMQSYNH